MNRLHLQDRYSVITVPTDALAPHCARPLASTVMIVNSYILHFGSLTKSHLGQALSACFPHGAIKEIRGYSMRYWGNESCFLRCTCDAGPRFWTYFGDQKTLFEIADEISRKSLGNFGSEKTVNDIWMTIRWFSFNQMYLKISSANIYFVSSLIHWGRVRNIFVGNLTIIVSDNGLSPGRHQAIIWTNAGILLIRPLGTNFSEISIEIHTF